jgi:hypothetical protein
MLINMFIHFLCLFWVSWYCGSLDELGNHEQVARLDRVVDGHASVSPASVYIDAEESVQVLRDPKSKYYLIEPLNYIPGTVSKIRFENHSDGGPHCLLVSHEVQRENLLHRNCLNLPKVALVSGSRWSFSWKAVFHRLQIKTPFPGLPGDVPCYTIALYLLRFPGCIAWFRRSGKAPLILSGCCTVTLLVQHRRNHVSDLDRFLSYSPPVDTMNRGYRGDIAVTSFSPRLYLAQRC